MNILSFIKSLFAKREEHIKSVKEIDKQIEEALYKVEPQEVKPKKKAKKKPTKNKKDGSK
jgi:hypothetical protein